MDKKSGWTESLQDTIGKFRKFKLCGIEIVVQISDHVTIFQPVIGAMMDSPFHTINKSEANNTKLLMEPSREIGSD
jgi:hypothetical protein